MKLKNKFLAAVVTFSFITLNCFAQNNSIVLDGAFIVLDGGTATNNIHLVIDQPDTLGIIRLPAGGHIHSENQYNSVKWLSGTSTGNYVFPFGVGGNATDYIPFTFNKTTAGSADISMATWATNQQNLPKPAATNVGAVSNMIGITDSVLYAIDRFWDIQTSAATTADLTFSYKGSENTTSSPTSLVKAEHWNGTTWNTPVGPGTTGVTTGIGTAGPFLNQSSFSPWALIIPCAPVTGTATASICQGDSILLAGFYQTTAGNYNDTIFDGSSQGCDSITTTSLTINPLPTISLTSAAGSDTQTMCGFAPITNITYTVGGSATGATVSGLPAGVTGSFSAGTFTVSGTPTVTGSFNYTVTTTGICTPAVSTGIIVINAIPASPTTSVTTQPTCTIPTGVIDITAPTGVNIQYSIGGAYQTSGTFAGLNPATYNVTAQDVSTGCISAVTTLTVNTIPSAPASPTGSVTIQPTCTTPTGAIDVTAPTGINIQYSIGGAFQTSGTFAGLNPATYNVTAQDISTGCISAATTLTVNAIPSAPASPTGSVTTQPTCTTPTGVIDITAPTGVNIQYSIGGAYQTSATFAGLNPATYNVTAQDVSTGCISAATTLTVNAIPSAPASPTGSVTTQPTCTTPTGVIDITAPTGVNIQYSIGGAYQTSATFAGLNPATYNVTAQDVSTGCISAATTLTVNSIPSAPASPTGSVTTQPTCTTPTGVIDITAPTGVNIQYSIGGAYQTGDTFTGLNPATYSVTAQDVSTGCISAITTLTVNAIPSAPATPTGSVTIQPTCTTPTGAIDVTAPTGVNIQYSIGGAYQTSGTFAGLNPATYNVTAQDISTGCISAATTLTVNAIPSAPASPTGFVTTQPTCTTPTGVIDITAPTGVNIQYSIGGAYQTSGTFTGLNPATYNVTAQDVSTGCISAATTLTVNPIPPSPTAPTASGATYCAGSTIAPITANGTGGTYNWYSDAALTTLVSTGATYTPSTSTTATYYVTETVSGCASSATSVPVTINQLPNVSGGSSQTICQGSSVTLTGTGATSYSWSGGIANGTAFIPTATNTYTVTGTDANSCVNTASVTITVSAPPTANAGADVTICSGSGATLTASGGATYLWDNGNASASINVNPTITTMYYVTVSNGSCSDNDTVIVNVISSPAITVSPDITISQGTSTILTASGGTNYSWSNGETTSSISVSPLNTTDYCVTASNASCSASACVKVTVDIKCGELFVPNGFSPNADGKNDVLEVYINKTCVKDFNFLIFDRWGEKIFESTNINNSWDGTYKGKALDAAVFVYYLNISLTNSDDPIILKGNVSIIK